MRSTFKLLYFVKRNAVKKNGNAPIIARITIDQVVAQFNTKLEINPAHWSVKLGKVSGRTAEAVHINSMLESIRSTIHQHYHALMAQDGYVTGHMVGQGLFNATNGCDFFQVIIHFLIADNG